MLPSCCSVLQCAKTLEVMKTYIGEQQLSHPSLQAIVLLFIYFLSDLPP